MFIEYFTYSMLYIKIILLKFKKIFNICWENILMLSTYTKLKIAIPIFPDTHR